VAAINCYLSHVSHAVEQPCRCTSCSSVVTISRLPQAAAAVGPTSGSEPRSARHSIHRCGIYFSVDIEAFHWPQAVILPGPYCRICYWTDSEAPESVVARPAISGRLDPVLLTGLSNINGRCRELTGVGVDPNFRSDDEASTTKYKQQSILGSRPGLQTSASQPDPLCQCTAARCAKYKHVLPLNEH
jgi:hypothetical protein